MPIYRFSGGALPMLQLRTIETIVNSCIHKEVTFRVKFRVQSDESFVIGKQRLAMEQDCSTVVYILGETIVEVWKTYGVCM